MIRFLPVCLLGILLVDITACRQHESTTQATVAESYISNSYSVGFDITPLPSGDGSTLWLATYAAQGKVAKFRIELDSAKPEDSGNSVSSPFKFRVGKGAILAEPGSDANVLLADLKRALGASNLPTRVQRSSSLPFACGILGQNESRVPGDGFSRKPTGNWIVMKIFISSSSGDEEEEMYLNINPVIRKAEFSEKDSSYGDRLLAKLATVL
jgi:hypothetical protein